MRSVYSRCMLFWKRRIYADAAGGVPPHVSPNALHQEGLAAKAALERARASVATSIGAHADEIIFLSSATEANNLACHAARQHALTTAVEHPSVLKPLRYKKGLELTELPVGSDGLIDLKKIAEAIRPESDFVSIQLVNSEIGTLQPVREIAKLLKKSGKKILLHTDATQAPLWVVINVERLGVDLMTLDDALYIRRGVELEPLMFGGDQERGLRAGTPNVPAAVAFAKALQEAQQGVAARTAQVAAVRDYCWQEIKKVLPDAILNGPALTGSRVANNLNISIPRLEAQMAVVSLDSLGIAASTRSACDVGSEEPSHVLKALGVPPELAGTAIRLTFLPNFSKSQARRIAKALKETADRYRHH